MTITPHRAKAARKSLKDSRVTLRETIALIRALDARVTVMAKEDAEGERAMLSHSWKLYDAARKWLRDCKVEKYSNLSPNAAARLSKR